jgi:hypothetical protein
MNYHIPSVVDGVSISVRQWVLLPLEVATKALLHLTHGMYEHSGLYDRFAHYALSGGPALILRVKKHIHCCRFAAA